MAQYISLYSGSSGNCSLVVEKNNFIIIDMGKSARITTQAIQSVGLDIKNLQGVLVSHEHSDHIAGLKVFLKKLNTTVFSNAATLDYLAHNDLIPEHITLEDIGVGGTNIGDFFVKGFDTPHDSAGCMGFNVYTDKGTRMTMATDLGCVTEDILHNFIGADLSVIEANYDEQMLKENINYPYYLKRRIESNFGHLSNIQSSEAIMEMLKGGAKKLHLCHLSNNNNTPGAALGQIAISAMAKGIIIDPETLIKANHRHEVTSPTDF